MNANDNCLLSFLSALGHLRAIARKVHIYLESLEAISSVCTEVSPFVAENASDYADCGVTLSLSVTAECASPATSDKKAMGASILIRHSHGKWVAEYELGWSGEDVGWDSLDDESSSIETDTIDELTPRLLPAGQLLFDRYKNMAEQL